MNRDAEGVNASLNGGCKVFRVFVDDSHTIPDRLIFGVIAIKTTDL